MSYTDADVVLICFSISNPISLQNVKEKWKPEVSHFCPRVPIVLVGLKKDTRTEKAILLELEKRDIIPVSSEDGQQMAESIEAKSYVECSAKTGEAVQEVFEIAARASLTKRRRKPLTNGGWRCELI